MQMNGNTTDAAPTPVNIHPLLLMFGSWERVPRCKSCPMFVERGGEPYGDGRHDACSRDPVRVNTWPESYCASHPFHQLAHMRVLNAGMAQQQRADTLAARILKPGG